jgi:hypothetical protein
MQMTTVWHQLAANSLILPILDARYVCDRQKAMYCQRTP